MSEDDASLVEIRVLRDHGESTLLCPLRYDAIVHAHETGGLYVGGVGEQVENLRNDPVGQILIQQQFHAGATNSFRSRSAANARHALMSSRVNSEKFCRISSSDMPPARYSRISCTVIRNPRMHGLPLRLPDSIVM